MLLLCIRCNDIVIILFIIFNYGIAAAACSRVSIQRRPPPLAVFFEKLNTAHYYDNNIIHRILPFN